MRRHGWGGELPANDAEAASRILAAARDLLDERPTVVPGIADVAERLSITRQTVYRYFPSSHALLVGAVDLGIDQFLDDLAAHVSGVVEPDEAVARLVAFTFDEIRRRPDLSLLLASGGTTPGDFTGPTALALGRSMLDRLDLDWASHGLDDDRLGELVELLLRLLMSFVFTPGDPAWRSDDVEGFVRRWIGPALRGSGRGGAE